LGGTTRLPISLENFPPDYIKPLGFESVKVNPVKAFGRSIWRLKVINICQRYTRPFSTRMNLAKAWPTKLGFWYRYSSDTGPMISRHRAILLPNLDQQSGTLSGEK